MEKQIEDQIYNDLSTAGWNLFTDEQSKRQVARHLARCGYSKQSEGEWIKKDGFLVCSKCDATKPIAFSTVLKITYYKCDFCHRCGVKMKGGE